MSKEIIFTCDECGSNDVVGKHERYDEKYNTHKDYDSLDYEVSDLVSYKERYRCKCNKCGCQWYESCDI